MEQVLLTGAGQVGAQMIRILRHDYQIKPVVLDLSFNWKYLDTVVERDWFTAIEGSVLDKDLVQTVINEHKITRISHSAAVLPMRVGHDPHLGFFEVNVHGTANLIFSAVKFGVKRFLLFSTNGVYQFREHGVSSPVDEDYPTGLSLHNSYGNSKAVVEYLLKELTNAKKIAGKIIRPGEIYGPVMSRAGEDSIYWQEMFDAAITGRPFTLKNHPEHRLDWIYCKDVAQAACLLLMAENTANIAYNATFGRCLGIYEIKEELDRLYPDNKIKLENCTKGGWNYPLDVAKLKSDLNFEPKYDLRDGIKDYAKWFLSVNKAC